MNVLTGGKVWIDNQFIESEIAFEREIVKIGHNLNLDGDRIDCTGKIILPGMIDAHVHFRDFDQSYKEDWQSAGRAAVKGGVSTVFEMPNTEPPTTTPEVIKEKRKRIAASVVNGYIYGGIVPENIKEIGALAPLVDAFKLYMGETTGGLIISKPNLQRDIFKRVADSGKVLAVHAQQLTSKHESDDIEIALEHALKSGVSLYLCHVRTIDGVKLALQGKREGLDVTIETCAHYLYFTERDVEKKQSWLKVNPPITSQEDQDFLWSAINDGLIDTLGSDHAPHSIEEKSTSFDDAPFGLPGVETSLPLMLDAVNNERITLERLIEIFCLNPAKRYGLNDKAHIAEGADADLVVVDMNKSQQITRENIASKCGWSPYEGMRLKGWPVMSFVGGERVYSS